ncbi:MAG: methyltransferase domain-containing protein [Pseudomonadota bacterium]
MTVARIVLGVLTLSLLAGFPLWAETRGADPVINRQYQDPDYGLWVERFEREGREVYDQREAIVAGSGVRPGMTVADVGAGTGLFTRLFARVVGPGGKVYAVDISKTFVDNVLRTAREQGLNNVSGIVNSQSDTGLPPASVDILFLCDTYHHFEHPEKMLASIRRALKPGGILVVIDFERIPGRSSSWVLGHVRAGREQAIREIEPAGFRLIDQPALLKENFYLRFRR